MKNKSVIIGFLIGIIMLIFIGCASTYTIKLIEDETRAPISSSIEIFDENGRDKIVSEVNSDKSEYKIDLNEINGDSFLVFIPEGDYFKIYEWINTPSKSEIKEFILEKRVTIISGYVLDDSTLSGISDCDITTMPSITKRVTTNKDGKYVIKSDEFAEGISYTIFASKPPEYIQSTTEITPIVNKRQDLEYPIYLQRTASKLGDVKLEGEEELEVPGGIGAPVN